MKPYDVEAAKVEIAAAAQRAVSSATFGIMEVAEQTMKKLDEQARAFESMPRDLPSLFKEASLFEVTEISPNGLGDVLDVSYMTATIGGAQIALTPSMLARHIPKMKHRVIVIFLPIAEPAP